MQPGTGGWDAVFSLSGCRPCPLLSHRPAWWRRRFVVRNQLYVGTGHSAHLTNSSVNFSQIELARASNLTVAELSAIVDRENAQQVGSTFVTPLFFVDNRKGTRVTTLQFVLVNRLKIVRHKL